MNNTLPNPAINALPHYIKHATWPASINMQTLLISPFSDKAERARNPSNMHVCISLIKHLCMFNLLLTTACFRDQPMSNRTHSMLP